MARPPRSDRVRLSERSRVALMVSAIPIGLLLWQGLPSLTGREDVHDSLWGRIRPVHEYAAANLSPTEIAFGHGFGLGTNALWTVARPEEVPREAASAHPVGDFMPAALFRQVGVVGLILAYAACGVALQLNPSAQSIGFSLVTASLAVNITELFRST